MRLSEHFTSEEMACKCGCGFDSVNPVLVDMLEVIRAHFGKPVIINSACRCESHNKAVGGRKNSQHLLGNAADIVVRGATPDDVHAYIDGEFKVCGLGRYKAFTHVDCRKYRARW